MGVPSYDFSQRRVLVAGGTRGLGLSVAWAFAEAGAAVTVTGTASLVSFYDPDVARFGYHQLDLTDGDEIAEFAARLGDVDVLVNAASPRLSTALDASEREFLAQASRLSLIGPFQLATRLRHRMAHSGMRGGGAVVNLPATRGWLALADGGPGPDAELQRQTQRLGGTWARLGVRMNTVTAPLVVPAPRPSVQVRIESGSGPLMTRAVDPRTATLRQIRDLTLFLASAGAAGVSGQTLPVGATVD